MRGQNYARAMFGGVINRREGRAHACVVFNFSIFDWDVEINTNENAFAGKIEIFYRELGHWRSCDFVVSFFDYYSDVPRTHTKKGLRLLSLKPLPGDVFHQIAYATRVAPFVVIPGEDLDHV